MEWEFSSFRSFSPRPHPRVWDVQAHGQWTCLLTRGQCHTEPDRTGGTFGRRAPSPSQSSSLTCPHSKLLARGWLLLSQTTSLGKLDLWKNSVEWVRKASSETYSVMPLQEAKNSEKGQSRVSIKTGTLDSHRIRVTGFIMSKIYSLSELRCLHWWPKGSHST